MSVSDDLYTKIRNWIRFILITEGGYTDLKIIQSHPNKPAPADHYIAIEDPGNITNIGRATKLYPPDDDGNTKIAIDEEDLIELWEIGGSGDLLRQIINSTERSEIQQTYFHDENISIRGINNIISIPQLDKNEWTKQSMVELRIGFTDVVREQSSWIDDVEINENLGGKQNE